MFAPKYEKLPIFNPSDIVLVRKVVRARTLDVGFGIIDQTKVVTAASELARNTLDYGGGGHVVIETLTNLAGKPGIRLLFEDHGAGIPDLELALTDGYTSGGGLGMGLSGSRRLMSDFTIESEVGRGTRVMVAKWK